VFVTNDGKQFRNDGTYVFRLKRGATGWQIDSTNAR
jgi:hypothetical protein